MTTFIISDMHFFHKNILTFTRANGEKLRNFSDVETMNETIINNWNNVVSDQDLVYDLGDSVFGQNNLHIISRLKGRKRLLLGNHDYAPITEYLKYYENVYANFELRPDKETRILLGHYPVHLDSIVPRYNFMVHGHIHSLQIDNPHYFCASVEQIDYTPISVDEIVKIMKEKL